jgi:hypothetical protein
VWTDCNLHPPRKYDPHPVDLHSTHTVWQLFVQKASIEFGANMSCLVTNSVYQCNECLTQLFTKFKIYLVLATMFRPLSGPSSGLYNNLERVVEATLVIRDLTLRVFTITQFRVKRL